MCPPLGTWPATQACALIGNRICDPLVHRPALNPLSHTSLLISFLMLVLRTEPAQGVLYIASDEGLKAAYSYKLASEIAHSLPAPPPTLWPLKVWGWLDKGLAGPSRRGGLWPNIVSKLCIRVAWQHPNSLCTKVLLKTTVISSFFLLPILPSAIDLSVIHHLFTDPFISPLIVSSPIPSAHSTHTPIYLLRFHLSIHPSMYLFIHLSLTPLPIHPIIHWFIHSSIHPLIHPSIYPSIHPFTNLLIPPIRVLIYPSIHVYPSIHPFTHSSNHLPTHPSIHAFIHPCVHFFIYWSVHKFINFIYSSNLSLNPPSIFQLTIHPLIYLTSI